VGHLAPLCLLLALLARHATPGRPAAARAGRRSPPALEPLVDRTVPTTFTLTSPTSAGLLPAGVTPVGGLVLDLVGAGGGRVVSQLPASGLFQGFFSSGTPAAFRGDPGTIGVQTGFTPEVVAALGGGLRQAAVRVTLFDGDTGADNFDRGENALLLNGLDFGDFSDVITQETAADGQTALSNNPDGGFRNGRLDTGFFFSDDPLLLGALYDSLANGEVRFALDDVDPFDNLFDFTRGVDGGLTGISKPPAPVNMPPRITAVRDDGAVPEGSPVRVTVAADDPDGAGRPLVYEFDFDGDGAFEVAAAEGLASHVFADEGSYAVGVRVRDAGGAEARGAVTVRVENVAPRFVSAALPGRVAAGGVVTLAAVVSDPGRQDRLDVVIDWGDGTTTALDGGRPVEQGHTFVAPGTYAVRLRVSDDDGGTDEVPLTVTVEAPPESPPEPIQQVGEAPAPEPAVPAPVSEAPTAPAPPAPVEPPPATTAVIPGAAPDTVESAPAADVPRPAAAQRTGLTARPPPEFHIGFPILLLDLVEPPPAARPALPAAALADAVRQFLDAGRGTYLAGQQALTDLANLLANALDGFAALAAGVRVVPIPAPVPSGNGPPPAAVVSTPAPAAAAPRRGPGATQTALVLLCFLVLYRHWQRSTMSAAAILHRRWARGRSA
jgi:PKD repeat protein